MILKTNNEVDNYKKYIDVYHKMFLNYCKYNKDANLFFEWGSLMQNKFSIFSHSDRERFIKFVDQYYK